MLNASQPMDGIARYVAPAVFVATMLFYTISITPFVDLTAAASVDPAADRSNTLNQLVFLGLTAALWILALRSDSSRALIARPRGLLLVIFIWFTATAIVGAHPDISLKRVVLAALTVINASIFLLLPRSDRQFATLVAICCLVTLAVAYLGVFFLPQLAIHQASEIREPMNVGFWRGHFPHKNAAAAAMLLLAFFGLYVRSAGSRIVGLAIVVLATIFLANTGGKTSTAELPAILAIAWVFERWAALRIPIVVGGIVGFNVVTIGCATSPAMRELVASIGIDPTFTHRVDIWSLALSAISDSPLLGHGFQGFWQTDELVYKGGGGASWAVAAYNGHSAFLDAAVNAGLVGLALTVAWVVFVPLFDVARAETSSNDPALTRLFLRLWLCGIFSGCVESLFFQSGDLSWFCLAFAIFGLGMQASAIATRAHPVPSWRSSVAHA